MKEKGRGKGLFTFEKDDDWHMRWIHCFANLRSWVFGIEFLNEFEGKNMVGNIIPAICSSNSIVAGIQTSETLKLLYKNFVFDQMKAKLGSSSTKNSQKTEANSSPDLPSSTLPNPNATI